VGVKTDYRLNDEEKQEVSSQQPGAGMKGTQLLFSWPLTSDF
jgi:hypothetical protein